MDEILNSVLRAAVYQRLDYLDTILEQAEPTSKATFADTAVPQLTRAWRELLDTHALDDRGRCRACSRGRLRGRRACTVLRTAQRHLIIDTAEPPAAGRHHLRRSLTSAS
ncbi:hypothetical protein [Amycolatopsis sp. PS_44_ISF1]|uniref:hypothetical protein n=1 Tax=Amycolatopsis sp. PS_44_ISF1 TaxID=2974917 RepID=UPI0028DF3E91|nr:hypothetical protein [Amycolatopsis sp. PS_44_ISF1]MDT8913532.1 hypothetical protein [Amycolatopsis sp. PS_44_ISF1]